MTDFDTEGLSRWLVAQELGLGHVRQVEPLSGGQSNPTYHIVTDTRDCVLRRKPFGPLLPSAHAIEREYRAISALSPAGFPVPRPITLCEDRDVIGAPFYLMDKVTGRSFWDATLPDESPATRRKLFEAMVDTQARLHRLSPEDIGLATFGKPDNYLSRQVSLWTRQYRAAETEIIPEMEELIRWLPTSLPEQVSAAVIHGDFRIDNLIYAPDRPDVLAVIDWELSTLGDPLADFTYLAMNWVMPVDGRSGLFGIDFEQSGIPTLSEVVTRYCRAVGRDGIGRLEWYFAFNLFRLAAILQGVKARADSGNAADPNAADMARRVRPLADLAWQQARRDGAQGGLK